MIYRHINDCIGVILKAADLWGMQKSIVQSFEKNITNIRWLLTPENQSDMFCASELKFHSDYYCCIAAVSALHRYCVCKPAVCFLPTGSLASIVMWMWMACE